MDFIRLFLNGALWSLCGSLTAVLTKNKYLSCAVPFILYYVLTVFQERYYRNYFFLSPKQWASPAYYGNGFCLLALLLISSLLALALRKCVVRRVVAWKKTQFKTDIHQIFLLTKRNFSDWGKNPRILVDICIMLCTLSNVDKSDFRAGTDIPDTGADVRATDLDLR